MTRDERQLLPINGKLFATARGKWRAKVEKGTNSSNRNLLHFRIVFESNHNLVAPRELELLLLNETWAAKMLNGNYNRSVRRAIRNWLEHGGDKARRFLDLSTWSLVPYIGHVQ